jgi:hypothetical protein
MLSEQEYIIDIDSSSSTTRHYRINQDISYTLESFNYHNEIETDVLMTLEQKSDQGNIFSVKLLRQYQLKTDGLDRWNMDMLPLRKNILIETNSSGKIKEVLNLAAIKAQWMEIMPAMAKKYANDADSKTVINEAVALLYTPGAIENVLQASYLYYGLLPGLYQQGFTKENNYAFNSKRIIANAIGANSIPFKTVARLNAYNNITNECQVKVEGEIDGDLLDKDSIAELMRNLTDVYNLNTHLIGFHMEDYLFDSQHWITESAQLTQYAMEGILMYRNLCTIKPLNQ